MKKVTAVIIAVIMVLSCALCVNAADVSRIEEYRAKFTDGAGPAVNGLTVDYVSYEPENKTDGTKYPLVVYIHGMGQGAHPRAQIEENNFALWTSEELQARFIGTQGAYFLVPRSQENKGEFWTEKYVESLKAAIDEFIADHIDSIDLTRIYIGGFSMGGKMTLKMLINYPGFFAAAFPMCPAYIPTDAEFEMLKDIPIWLTVSKYDVIAGYYTNSQTVWNKLCAVTNMPENCRLSLIGRVKFPDGKNTQSNHHVWFAAENDLFTYEEGDYYNMTTCNALGEEITLTSPNGLISWVSSFTSNYAGESIEPTHLTEGNDVGVSYLPRMIKAIFMMLIDILTGGKAC